MRYVPGELKLLQGEEHLVAGRTAVLHRLVADVHLVLLLGRHLQVGRAHKVHARARVVGKVRAGWPRDRR